MSWPQQHHRPLELLLIPVLAFLLAGLSGGCATIESVPVATINDPSLITPMTSGGTIDLSQLQRRPSDRYFVNVGDTLGIYIRDAMGSGEIPGPINFPIVTQPRYPGQVAEPQLGVPIKVNEDGDILLPNIPPVKVAGLTLGQVADAIRRTYFAAEILRPGNDFVTVTLIKPRTVHVTVFREDSETLVPTQVRKDSYMLSKRGTAQVLEMPGTENDVLHALAATGGLPGTDAYNHVWVIRAHPQIQQYVNTGFAQTAIDETVLCGAGVRFTRIPLTQCPGTPFELPPEAVVLHEGDVVYVEARKTDFFYVGGLLGGGQIPLPRDYDLDIFGAIAMANGSLIGPTGGSSNNFTAGPGNVIPPTRALVSRRSPDGSLQLLEIDLRRALVDPRERLLIRPGDVVLLKYRPLELVGNIGLNLVNFNFAIPDGQ